MDYMLLGIQSRKTGLNAKRNIKKDEYSMESVDEFFNDDDTSMISAKRKSRRSSLLLDGSQNNILPPVDDQQVQYKAPQDSNSSFRSSRRSTEQFQGQYSPPFQGSLETIDEHFTMPSDHDDEEQALTPKKLSREVNLEGDGALGKHAIKLTPEKRPSRMHYSDVPDLVEDDEEDTRDFTSLNTSENALLEDELDDDYVLESEEDKDYVEGESLLKNGQEINDGEEDEDSSDSCEDSSSDDMIESAQKSQHYGGDKLTTEVYDSDEEFIQNQASQLVNDRSSGGLNGLRRSNRVKIAPLEYWRNERVIYKRKSDKPVLDIDKIVTYDHKDDDEEEDGQQRRRKRRKPAVRTRPYNYVPSGKPRGRPRKNKTTNSSVTDPNIELLDDINFGNVPTAEWLKHGILETDVNVTPNRKANEIVAFAPNLAQSEQTKETDEESFSLEVMFDKHKDHFASGMLKLPVNGKKKPSDSFRTFLTFYVIQGIVEVALAGHVFLGTEGSSIQIPAFNEYGFRNRGNNEVRMFFVQVTLEGADETDDNLDDDLVQTSSAIDRSNDIRGTEGQALETESSLSSMSISAI